MVATSSGLEPLDPGDLRESTIVGEHFFDLMLTHDAEMDPIASGQAGVILGDPAGLRALRYRQ